MPDGPVRTGPGPPGRSADELTRGIARGDADALAEFYARWFDRLLALASSLTRRDESFCLDVVQEAMLRVVRCIRPMRSDEDVLRWMTRVVHTTALDLLRREARRAARERRGTVPASSRDAAADTALGEQIAWVRSRLVELPPHDADLIGLRFSRGASLRAAGDAAGVTGDSAHGRIRRTLARLRTLAKEAFDE